MVWEFAQSQPPHFGMCLCRNECVKYDGLDPLLFLFCLLLRVLLQAMVPSQRIQRPTRISIIRTRTERSTEVRSVMLFLPPLLLLRMVVCMYMYNVLFVAFTEATCCSKQSTAQVRFISYFLHILAMSIFRCWLGSISFVCELFAFIIHNQYFSLFG